MTSAPGVHGRERPAWPDLRAGLCNSGEMHTWGVPQAQSRWFMLDQERAPYSPRERPGRWQNAEGPLLDRALGRRSAPPSLPPCPQGGAGSEGGRSLCPLLPTLPRACLQAARSTSELALPWGPRSTLEGDEPDCVNRALETPGLGAGGATTFFPGGELWVLRPRLLTRNPCHTCLHTQEPPERF